jgi:hypothetical protein
MRLLSTGKHKLRTLEDLEQESAIPLPWCPDQPAALVSTSREGLFRRNASFAALFDLHSVPPPRGMHLLPAEGCATMPRVATGVLQQRVKPRVPRHALSVPLQLELSQDAPGQVTVTCVADAEDAVLLLHRPGSRGPPEVLEIGLSESLCEFVFP